VNWNALYAVLDNVRAKRGVLWRDIAHETGIHQSTLTRLKQGKGVDVDTYAALCRWLGMSLDMFVPPSFITAATDADLGTDLVLLFARHAVPEVYWAPLASLVTNLTPAPPQA
jgi:DNA-binding Xre family transcriptional regulator